MKRRYVNDGNEFSDMFSVGRYLHIGGEYDVA